jgi:hypothetical protein
MWSHRKMRTIIDIPPGDVDDLEGSFPHLSGICNSAISWYQRRLTGESATVRKGEPDPPGRRKKVKKCFAKCGRGKRP